MQFLSRTTAFSISFRAHDDANVLHWTFFFSQLILREDKYNKKIGKKKFKSLTRFPDFIHKKINFLSSSAQEHIKLNTKKMHLIFCRSHAFVLRKSHIMQCAQICASKYLFEIYIYDYKLYFVDSTHMKKPHNKFR